MTIKSNLRAKCAKVVASQRLHLCTNQETALKEEEVGMEEELKEVKEALREAELDYQGKLQELQALRNEAMVSSFIN